MALDKALADWYDNAKEIAQFLTSANPKNWPATATEPMMKAHIDQTTAYAVDLLKMIIQTLLYILMRHDNTW